MNAPDDTVHQQAWLAAVAQYPVGSPLTGTVVHQAPFGVFLDVGLPGVKVLLEIIHYADAPEYDPANPPAAPFAVHHPALGETVTATVFGHLTREIRVSAKPIPALK
ncbi:hypothetical protein [Hymenobacter negativus]|uniref:S1 RNA-binding domain-containing protein n=1 Tax=Hymenobacter negativus TaxID=2795026 RepID=A0ABS3QPR9_9BACT|nr:hypothetical protein [Hymenobacter negativus]MBO2012923.1 hypothetical protein [Hymenobacter negativus]